MIPEVILYEALCCSRFVYQYVLLLSRLLVCDLHNEIVHLLITTPYDITQTGKYSNQGMFFLCMINLITRSIPHGLVKRAPFKWNANSDRKISGVEVREENMEPYIVYYREWW